MIGAGDWSVFQLEAWNAVTNAEIVALCDQQSERLTQRAAQFGITHTYTAVETMLADADLDFVDICTRPVSHAALVRLVASHDLPILCQKPFCTTLDEARSVVKFCQDSGARLMVNENFRWQPWYRQIKDLLQQQSIGEPFLGCYSERARLFMPTFNLDRQRYLTTMPQLLIYETGVHLLDTLRFLFGEPESVYARLHRISPNIAGEDVAFLTIGYPTLTYHADKSWASIAEHRWNEETSPYLEIDGTAGTLILKWDRSLNLYTEHGLQNTWQFRKDARAGSRVATQQHFVDCLSTGTPFETSGESTLKTLALVYACYQSAKEGRVVNMAEYEDKLL